MKTLMKKWTKKNLKLNNNQLDNSARPGASVPKQQSVRTRVHATTAVWNHSRKVMIQLANSLNIRKEQIY